MKEFDLQLNVKVRLEQIDDKPLPTPEEFIDAWMKYNNRELLSYKELAESGLNAFVTAYVSDIINDIPKPENVLSSSLEEDKKPETLQEHLKRRELDGKAPYHDMFGPEGYTYKIEASEQKDSPL